MLHANRNIVKIIKEICKEDDIKLESFSYDWIFKLTKNNISKHVFGYRLEINSCVTDRICVDKSATSDLLTNNDIPCVKHTFFMGYEGSKYLGVEGNWEKLLSMLNEHKKLVCKPNEGAGGFNVFLVQNKLELENAVTSILNKDSSMAICPYEEIINEYRTIILNGEIKLIYAKKKPFVVGNGKDTVFTLLNGNINNNFNSDVNYNYIPKKDEVYQLNWKHNLAFGNKPLIETNKEVIDILTKMALKTANTLNLIFGTVDIIDTKNGYKVLEVNSSVSMDFFSGVSEENYEKAKSIYREAIEYMMSNE
jgi:glutathione synthase/RimK-type ligase-like ATP-grasp enzyme